jgi:hypothetical protein
MVGGTRKAADSATIGRKNIAGDGCHEHRRPRRRVFLMIDAVAQLETAWTAKPGGGGKRAVPSARLLA